MRKIHECAEDIKNILNDAERTEEVDGETLCGINELVDEILSIHCLEEQEAALLKSNFEKKVCTGCWMDDKKELATLTKSADALITYLFNNMHWCPFKDEANIDFDKECVGFRETGCKECILRNIGQLN